MSRLGRETIQQRLRLPETYTVKAKVAGRIGASQFELIALHSSAKGDAPVHGYAANYGPWEVIDAEQWAETAETIVRGAAGVDAPTTH